MMSTIAGDVNDHSRWPAGRLITRRQSAAGAWIGGADESSRSYPDRICRRARPDAHDFLSAHFQTRNDIGREGLLDDGLIGPPLMMHPGRRDRVRDRKLEIDLVDNDLQHGRDD